MSRLRIGSAGSHILDTSLTRRDHQLSLVKKSAIDHLFVADHVSFHDGSGMDGIVNAATLGALLPNKAIVIGVYLLALRHPVVVARQLSSLSQSNPGRLTLGVGIGGEDRHEMEICGVDPAKRGRRTNDCLAALRELLSGNPVTYACEFFEFTDALITPAPTPHIPIIVGGRSDAAVERTGKYGDGWLGLWTSPARFRNVVKQVEEIADKEGRQKIDWQHGLQLWAGCDNKDTAARAFVAESMENFYKTPFEKFEKYTPYGTPEQIAEFLVPYVDAGARTINIEMRARTTEAALAATSEVTRLLKKHFSTDVN